ncbi:MAG: CoA transferase [Alphaproteobacteria bacterium]
MSAPLLTGIRVIEIAGARGAVAGRYLASLGADVTRIGPSDGDAANALGKRQVAEPEDLEPLIAAADILIASDPREFRSGQRFDRARLDQINLRLVSAALTPFGIEGPYADFSGPEIVVSAMGGCLGVVGYEDRPPVKEALEACGYHAEMMAVAGCLMAIWERETSGCGQLVDISVQEVAASRVTNGVLSWQFDHRLLERSGVALSYGKARVRCVWDLKDGAVFHSLMTGGFGAPANAALSAWMDEAGVDNPMRGIDWLKYDRSALPAETRAVWETAIDAFFRSITKAEMRVEGRRRGINACVVNAPGDVLDDAHLAARGFWTNAGGVRLPKRFVRVADVAGRDLEPSTAHSRESGNPEASSAGARSAWVPAVAGTSGKKSGRDNCNNRGALAGVRVLDFSWALVGSITTKLLADNGAEVIKVESSTRPCLSRIDVQITASKRGNFDDKPWFIHMNTGKQSLRLNMKRKEAREVIDPLIARADVIVENFSPGTMASLGLDYATLAAKRPDLIMVSGSVFGQTGPLAKEWGVDGTGAALSGRLALTGWPDRTPVTPSSVPYGDVVLPPIMAAAAAAALHYRRRTGKGVHIDASMYEACAQQMAPAILAAQAGPQPHRHGNDDPACVLQGVYLAGSFWIAIRVEDEAAWKRLGRLIGGEWGPSAYMLSPDQRRATEAHIRFWLEMHEPWDAMATLQHAGVAAGVVQSAADLVDRDPQLRARNFLVDLPNPALGRFEHQASPIHLSRTPAALRTAPGLGEHTRQICSEIIGLSPQRIAELEAAGVFE